MKCRTCDKEFEIITRSDCLVCVAKKTHSEQYDKLLKDGFWTEKEIDSILFCMKYKKPNTINEMLEYIPNKTIDDLFILLDEKFIFGGQTKKRILQKCPICNSEFQVEFYKYKLNKEKGYTSYCSEKCMGKARVGKYLKENSPRYSKVKCNCDYCNKEIEVTLSLYNNSKRQNGEARHNFCSSKCSGKFRSENYSGKNHPMYGVKFDEKRIQSMKIIGAESVKKTKQTLTVPHVMVNDILNINNIKYVNEHVAGYYSLDILLKNTNLSIEVMGDYWHFNPNIKYNIIPNKMQKRNILRDKQKRTYVKKYNGITILYLWESEIKKDIKLCELLINEYINKNGILQDYNSFNYYVNGNKLLLKSELVKPYFIN